MVLLVKNHLGPTLIAVALISLLLAATSALLSTVFRRELLGNRVLNVSVSKDAVSLVTGFIKTFSDNNPDIRVEYVENGAEVVIKSRMIRGGTSLRLSSLLPSN